MNLNQLPGGAPEQDLAARFGPLAQALCGRRVEIRPGRTDELTYTDGATIFLSSRPGADPYVEIAVQCALLTAGSLDWRHILSLVGRQQRGQRYLALEVARVLTTGSLLTRLIIGDKIAIIGQVPSSPEESLRLCADRHVTIVHNPFFGLLRPVSLMVNRGLTARGAAHPDDIARNPSDHAEDPSDLDEDAEAEEMPKFLKNLASPINMPNPFVKIFSKIMGMRRTPSSDTPGQEISSSSMRKSKAPTDPNKGQTTSYSVSGIEASTTHTVSRWMYPEWDCLASRYRENWCSVHEIPFAHISDQSYERTLVEDNRLGRMLHRLAVGMRRQHRQVDGEDLDLDALIDFTVYRQSGKRLGSSQNRRPRIYTSNRRTARDLAVAIMIDVSGSVAEQGIDGKRIIDDQIRAAAILTHWFAIVGDRITTFAFHSSGRDQTRVIALKAFNEQKTHAAVRQIMSLKPSGYSRLGAGIRHGTFKLVQDSGVERRLLVVVSDGVPYDMDYAGRYASEDVIKALSEATALQVQVLWICFGKILPLLEQSFTVSPHKLVKVDDYLQLSFVLPNAIIGCLSKKVPMQYLQKKSYH